MDGGSKKAIYQEFRIVREEQTGLSFGYPNPM